MRLFTKLKEFYYETWNMYRQIGLDKTNKKQFIKTITEECADQKSEFIKKNLKVGDDGESIVYITSVPQEVQNYGQDFVIMDIPSVIMTMVLGLETTQLRHLIHWS